MNDLSGKINTLESENKILLNSYNNIISSLSENNCFAEIELSNKQIELEVLKIKIEGEDQDGFPTPPDFPPNTPPVPLPYQKNLLLRDIYVESIAKLISKTREEAEGRNVEFLLKKLELTNQQLKLEVTRLSKGDIGD